MRFIATALIGFSIATIGLAPPAAAGQQSSTRYSRQRYGSHWSSHTRHHVRHHYRRHTRAILDERILTSNAPHAWCARVAMCGSRRDAD